MTIRIDVINTALGRLGAAAIQSESQPRAAKLIRAYDSITNALLSGYPWSFAKRTQQLARLSAAPTAFWAYVFQKPSDMLGSPRAMFADPNNKIPFTAWEAGETGYMSDAEELWAQYTRITPPALWPAHWLEMATVAIMSDYALSVREDKPLQRELRSTVWGNPSAPGEGGLLYECKLIDASSQPAKAFVSSVTPLIAARR